MRQRGTAAAATLAAAALALAACGGDAGDAGEAEGEGPSGEITAAFPLDVVTFDPYLSQTGPHVQYLTPVYDTLIRRTPDMELEPSLATEWDFGDDNQVFEMSLRTDVAFSDGTPFDAEAVRANIEHGQDSGGPFASVLEPVEEVEVVDDATVRLHLSEPAPTIALGLSSVTGMMVSPEALDGGELDSVPAGSGAYELSEESVPGQEYVFTAREDYWNPDAFGPETLVLKVMSDADARVNALRSGQVDMTVVFPQQAASVEGAAGVTILSQPLNVQGLALLDRGGELVPELADERVRQALNYAVDREAVVEAVTFGYGEPWAQVYPPGSLAASDTAEERYPYDPDEAERLLAEAGYEDGFTLPVAAEAQFGTYLEALDGQLREVGVQLDINLDEENLASLWGSGEEAAPMLLYGVDDVYTASNVFALPDSPYNPFGAELPGVDDAFAGVQDAADDEERAGYYHEISEEMTDQGWFLITHFVESLYAVNEDKVSGVELYRGNSLPYVYGWQPVD